MDKAVILVSGGMDSATCLWWAKKCGWELNTITYNYFQRTDREIEATNHLIENAKVHEHRTVDIPFLRDIEDILKYSTEAYIPARSGVFYGLAASWAEALGAERIIGGHNNMDSHLFPDSTPKFFEALNTAFRVGTWMGRTDRLEVIRPLEKLDKTGILRLAIDLKVPIDLTWSCYRGRERACGVCDACVKRLRAFEETGLRDPVEYEDRI